MFFQLLEEPQLLSAPFVSSAYHLHIPSFSVEGWPIQTYMSFSFVFFCSWSQILETLPLPNVRIQFIIFFQICCSFVLDFTHATYITTSLSPQRRKNVISFNKYIYSMKIGICGADQMDLPNSSHSTCSFTWWISMHCL